MCYVSRTFLERFYVLENTTLKTVSRFIHDRHKIQFSSDRSLHSRSNSSKDKKTLVDSIDDIEAKYPYERDMLIFGKIFRLIDVRNYKIISVLSAVSSLMTSSALIYLI